MSHQFEKPTVDMKSEYIPHYYERNIVDIKNEYTSHLIGILVPLLYEGIVMYYDKAEKYYLKLAQVNPNTKPTIIVKVFKELLRDAPNLNSTQVEKEVARIKEHGRCSEIFDNLVQAVIKSYIVLLTYNASGKTCRLVIEKYHDRINVNDFIHKCYIECAHIFHNNPELITRSDDAKVLKTQHDLSYKYIKSAIIEAIHKVLPMRAILDEYLANDYIVERNFHQKLDRYVHPPRDAVPQIVGNEATQNGYSVVPQNGGEDGADSLSHNEEMKKDMADVVKGGDEKPEIENQILDPLANAKILEDNKPHELIIDNILPDGNLLAKEHIPAIQPVPKTVVAQVPVKPANENDLLKIDEKDMNEFFQSIDK